MAKSSSPNKRTHGQSRSSSSSVPRLQLAPPSARPSSNTYIDDVDAAIARQDVLIPSRPSSSRASRPLPLPSAHQSTPSTPSSSTIQSYHNNFTFNNRHDVLSALNSESRPSQPPTSIYNNVRSQQPQLSSPAPPRHESLNSQPPYFGNSVDLASHYGIPRILPPTPNAYNIQSDLPPSQPVSAGNATASQFQSTLSAYLNMMSNKPEESAVSPRMAAPPLPVTDVAAQQFPQDQLVVDSSNFDWTEYLTSPLEDTPYDTFLDTPANGMTLGDDFYTAPMIADNAVLDSFDIEIDPSMPSFTDHPVFADEAVAKSMPPPPPPRSEYIVQSFDGLLPMSPAVESSLLISPQIIDSSSLFTESTKNFRAKSRGPNGTRKNVTPESLVPLDAPTQSRNYVAPSSTSRKELPAAFAKKREASVAFADEEDELVDDKSGLTMTEQEAIAAKRRQNTLAARRSRKRKLQYQQELEGNLENERLEKEHYKGRVLVLEAYMVARGIQVPPYNA